MTRWMTATLASATLLLGACVTINVYFPEAAAEKAADRIIEDVLGKQGKTGNEQSSLFEFDTDRLVAGAQSLARGALDLVVPAANAQADLNVSTPAIRALTASMKERNSQLEKHYASGAVGFNAEGLVEIRDANAVPLPERTVVRKLVSDENADRAALYAEIAKANNHPEWEADIRKTFAERWVANASAGWWYKSAAGQWAQK